MLARTPACLRAYAHSSAPLHATTTTTSLLAAPLGCTQGTAVACSTRGVSVLSLEEVERLGERRTYATQTRSRGHTSQCSVDVPLVMLPGLGADSRIFMEQAPVFPQLSVVPWIKNTNWESLESYGARIADSIQKNNSMFKEGSRVASGEQPYVLGGVSFGGMVALEVSRHLRPQPAAVVLISSCRSYNAIPEPYRALARLADSLPSSVVREQFSHMLAKLTANRLSIKVFGHTSEVHASVLLEMLTASSPTFVSWGVGALCRWDWNVSISQDSHVVPVRAIHGANDNLIPASRVDADVVVPGAGHVANMTHPEQVNAFLTSVLASVAKK